MIAALMQEYEKLKQAADDSSLCQDDKKSSQLEACKILLDLKPELEKWNAEIQDGKSLLTITLEVVDRILRLPFADGAKICCVACLAQCNETASEL